VYNNDFISRPLKHKRRTAIKLIPRYYIMIGVHNLILHTYPRDVNETKITTDKKRILLCTTCCFWQVTKNSPRPYNAHYNMAWCRSSRRRRRLRIIFFQSVENDNNITSSNYSQNNRAENVIRWFWFYSRLIYYNWSTRREIKNGLKYRKKNHTKTTFKTYKTVCLFVFKKNLPTLVFLRATEVFIENRNNNI